MQIYKLVSLVALLFLFTACEEKYPVYSSFCEQNSSFRPPCLHYPLIEPEDLSTLEKVFGLENDPTCDYRVKLTKYRIGACNNPVVKSTGSDFQGYVRVEVLKGFICYYKAQSDYARDRGAAFDRVLSRIEEDQK